MAVKYGVAGEFPSAPSYRYLHEQMLGRDDLRRLDARNREDLRLYIENIHTMEQLTRVQTNLALLRKHQQANLDAGHRPMQVEVLGLRIGDWRMVTFPGEPSVEIGLNIKKASAYRHTFVAGCTNGYLYYAPTAEQLRNVGGSQEDSDCRLAPEWQKLYQDKVAAMLSEL